MIFEPKWLAWEVTRRCNFKCVHCRSSSTLEVQGHPDFALQEGFRIIDDITDFAKPVLVLSGGEPLVRPDVFDLAAYGTQKGLRMCMATNGRLVDDAVCKAMHETGIRQVALSLDGADAQTHDDFRQQPGAFEGVMRAAELFNQHGIKFLINSSFTKRNQNQIQATYELAKKIGAQAWYMFMVVPTGRGEELLSELIPVDDYQEILDWHYEMERDEQDMLVRPTCAPHYYRVRFERNRADSNKVKSRPLSFSPGGSKGCLAGQTIALIDVDQNVLPCSYLPISAGNLKEQSFAQIWQYAKVFEDFRDYSRYKDNCGQCEYIKICGGCRARAHYMKGDYLAQEPFCQYVPKRVKACAER